MSRRSTITRDADVYEGLHSIVGQDRIGRFPNDLARPAVVVSDDAANMRLNRVQLVPLSGRVERLYPAEIHVDVEGSRRKAMADQTTTVSGLRLLRRMGVIAIGDIDAVARVIRLQPAL